MFKNEINDNMPYLLGGNRSLPIMDTKRATFHLLTIIHVWITDFEINFPETQKEQVLLDDCEIHFLDFLLSKFIIWVPQSDFKTSAVCCSRAYFVCSLAKKLIYEIYSQTKKKCCLCYYKREKNEINTIFFA